jgi:hypothetical protein
MPNSIKRTTTGDTLQLQVTISARKAGLVEETADGELARSEEAYVYGFRDVLLAVGIDSVSVPDRASLVAYAAKRLQSLHGGHRASVTIAGNGYQVRLPDCRTAGFSQGETAPVLPAGGVLVIHREDRRREDAREIQKYRIRQTGQETLG